MRNRGYTLERLEVYNWGTFHNRIYVLNMDNDTSILTGKNGSGKSTLVDALLTLLVPSNKRSYNQASGERRNDRQEKSYVRGAYNRVSDGASTSNVKYLREPNKSYTVLVAVFHCATAKVPYVTIAQLMLPQEQEIVKHFVVAKDKLSISQHFALHKTDIRALLKTLRTSYEVFSAFRDYSSAFRRLLYLPTEQSMNLFNHTVSMKEIGSLNEFVRRYMLEGIDSEKIVEDLRTNFEDLTVAHNAILKADEQQKFLTPLMSNYHRFVELNQAIDILQTHIKHLPVYIESRRLVLLGEEHTELQIMFDDHQSHLVYAEKRRHEANEQRIKLQVEIEKDKVGSVITDFEKQITQLGEERRKRIHKFTEYRKLVSNLALTPVTTSKEFFTNRQSASERLAESDATRLELTQQRDNIVIEINNNRKTIQEFADELDTLKKGVGSIPKDTQQIRNEIAHYLRVDTEELPFVGELIAVKDAETAWEGAIERLLRPFALSLVVDGRFAAHVRDYVDRNHLRAKLVYHVVDSSQPTNKRSDKSSVYDKLRVKQNTSYSTWIMARLQRNYLEFVCVESPDELVHHHRALTLQGQIKQPDRFEKDDRYTINDRTRYVLGWDNQAKIRVYEEQLSEAKNQLYNYRQQEEHLDRLLKKREDDNRLLDQLLSIVEYSTIDVVGAEKQINDVEIQLQSIQSSANHLGEIKKQLKQAVNDYADADNHYSQLQLLIGQTQVRLNRNLDLTQRAEHSLDTTPYKSWDNSIDVLDEEMKRYNVSLNTLDDCKEEIRNGLSRRSANYLGTSNTLSNGMSASIQQFRSNYPTDSEGIGVGLEALPDLETLLTRIVRDDLPRYRKAFKEMLDKKIIENIGLFKSQLEEEVEKYKGVVKVLNLSLSHLNYEPSSYIQLLASNTKDMEILQFRQELQKCIENTLEGSIEANEIAFENIRTLIHKLEKDERWKLKVIDVRNWLEFSARELWRDDHTQKSFHSDSSAMSGGQKTKLAYTILASAIAHQYGLSDADNKKVTFRFVVIDEAFSKADHINAQYAMELFRELGLQLLVVTPMNSVNIVEPYVGSYHLVTNTEQGNDSKVATLTVDRFHDLVQSHTIDMDTV